VRRPLALIGLVAVLLAGCGGGDDEGARTATVEAGTPVDVVGREYSFDPKNVVVRGAAGRPLEIRLKNEGSLAHNLKVSRGDQELGGTTTFQGGETRSARLDLAAGSYRMVCTVGNHEELGMHGKIEIR
jgi:plastocyanin